MKNKLAYQFILSVLVLISVAVSAEAKSVVGDIILQGKVARSGQQLSTDSSVFEGDSIRTERVSGGVLRIGRGRVEIGESSEVEIVRRNPLKLVLKTGTLAFNFPAEAALEIETPQLEIHPNLGDAALSGIVSSTPETEDRVQSRSGNFTVLERQKNGAANHIVPGQIVIAALIPAVRLSMAFADPISPEPQGPMVGTEIAHLDAASGDVRVARKATPNNYARSPVGLTLASGDFVRTLNGLATVKFKTDASLITLREGTTVLIQEQMQAGTVSRRVTQAIGNLWFSIQRVTGTQTTLETPTAVAAIRGTEGEQDVPNSTQSIHALNEGLEQITEVVTSTSVTLRSGQRVTAIRGVGFTPVVALLAAIAQPLVGAGGGGGAGGAGGGAGGGAAGGAGGAAGGGVASSAAGAATSAASAATVSTVSTVASIAATAVATAGALTAATLTPVIASNTTTPASASGPTTPLNPPGGG
jgi:FecR protein